MTRSRSQDVRAHVPFLIVFLLLGVLYFGTIRQGHDWGGDFSVYIAQARNFASGAPFSQSTYLVSEESARAHPAVYPPLSGLVLAPVYSLWGLNYVALKIPLVFFLWLSLVVYYLFALRRGVPPAAAAVCMAVFGLAIITLEIKEWIGSDAVALFVAGLTLLFLEEVYRRNWDNTRPIAAAVPTAVLLLLGYLARATGLCLIVAFLLYEVVRVRRIRLYPAVTFVLIGAAMILYTTFVFDAGQHYGNQFDILIGRYIENVLYYLRAPATFWGGAPSILRYPLTGLLLLLAIAGLARRLRRPGIAEFYFVIFIGLLIVYSSGTGVRYAFPLLPLLLLYAAEPLVAWFGSRPRVLAACAAIVLVASVLNLRTIQTGVITEGILKPSFVEVCTYLRDRTPSQATVVSWNPRVIALYTGKTSAAYPRTADPRTFETRMPGTDPMYLLAYRGQGDYERLRRALAGSGSRWTSVWRNSEFEVFQRQPR